MQTEHVSGKIAPLVTIVGTAINYECTWVMSNAPNNILIVGGGTAGWMTAIHMQHQWADKGINISLIESPGIGTVGVGEGTTPMLREFYTRLDIPESEWMPACNATYKNGISFPDWSTVPGYENYFHPFFSDFDKSHIQYFWDNCNLRRNGHDIPAHPDDYFVTTALSRQFRSPIPKHKMPTESMYGYHFDAGLMGEYLKGKAVERGVTLIQDTINEVNLDRKGDIASVMTDAHGRIKADFYVDCSGFRGLLIRQALGEQPVSSRDFMFNDSAVAIQTPIKDKDNIMSETISRALKYGWVWHIPLSNRMGNGYVYCSDYINEEQAEAEFREYLGVDAEGASALHLHWSPGRIENHWKNNCVAIGLSQGFLEPLEALMINVIQMSIECFTEYFEKGIFSNEHRQDFNGKVNKFIDGIRDYLQLHYKINSRDDTQYWRDARDNPNMSQQLAAVIEAWDNDDNIDRVLFENINQQLYPRTSWYCMLAGMGRFPEASRGPLRLPARNQKRARASSEEKAEHFYPHAEYLKMLYGGK